MNQPIYFDDVTVGDPIPPREYGPLTIVDTVRWAGLQENWQHLHYDRDHVREHNGLSTFIASGLSPGFAHAHVDRLDRSAWVAQKDQRSAHLLDV